MYVMVHCIAQLQQQFHQGIKQLYITTSGSTCVCINIVCHGCNDSQTPHPKLRVTDVHVITAT